MAQMCIALYVGLSLHLLFATVLHQGAADFVSTPPPTTSVPPPPPTTSVPPPTTSVPPPTTSVPPPPPTTSVPPPTTSVPPPPPTTSVPPPHKGPGVPAQGDYSVKNETGTVCLKAKMALQINITLHSASLNTIVQKVVNLNPNETASSGSCDKERAILKLNSPQQTELTFQFTLNTTSKRYNLNSVSISASWPDMAEGFSAHNDSLDYLQGNLGFSYMCRSEQTLEVSQNFSLKTYFLHVQPFGLTGDAFGSALECLLDQDDLVIPIVVGAALAGLVLVVLLAYMIGRKRSHAGYQTI